MATIIFSPPIIKLALLLILAVVGFAVTAWMIQSDVKEMAERAERADQEWKHHPMSGRTNGIISDVKAFDYARTNEQIMDDYARTNKAKKDNIMASTIVVHEDNQIVAVHPATDFYDPSYRSRSVPKIKTQKNRGQKKDNSQKDNSKKDNYNRHKDGKGGGAR